MFLVRRFLCCVTLKIGSSSPRKTYSGLTTFDKIAGKSVYRFILGTVCGLVIGFGCILLFNWQIVLKLRLTCTLCPFNSIFQSPQSIPLNLNAEDSEDESSLFCSLNGYYNNGFNVFC